MYSCKLAQNIEIFVHIKNINYLKLPTNVYKNIFLALKKKLFVILSKSNCITDLSVYIINIYTQIGVCRIVKSSLDPNFIIKMKPYQDSKTVSLFVRNALFYIT